MNKNYFILSLLLILAINLQAQYTGTPYTGTAIELPGTVEAEFFDIDTGDGMAYNIFTSGQNVSNIWPNRTNDAITWDATNNPDGIKFTYTPADVASGSNGAILGLGGNTDGTNPTYFYNYTVKINTTGTYSIDVVYKHYWSAQQGTKIKFYKPSDMSEVYNILTPLPSPGGAWSTETFTSTNDAPIQLEAGTYVMQFFSTAGNSNNNCSIDRMDFTLLQATAATNKKSNNVTIYCSNNILTVDTKVAEALTLSVYDLSGKVVYTSEIDGLAQIPLNLTKGIYITNVKGESFSFTKKIAIK